MTYQNNVLDALKNIDPKSTATKWVIPGQNPKTSDITKPSPSNNEISKPEIKEDKTVKPLSNAEKPEHSIKDEINSSKIPPPTTEAFRQPMKEETNIVKDQQPKKSTYVEPKVRKANDPEPDFKKKLEELHSKPNRPGVIAQHEFQYREPPEVHASYTKLQKKSSWTGPAPKTFDEKVGWLDATGEFHYYQYKQSQPKKYTDYPDYSRNATPTNNDNSDGPSTRNTGVDMDHVPSKSKFSSLLAVYNS